MLVTRDAIQWSRWRYRCAYQSSVISYDACVLRDNLGQRFKVLRWGRSDYGSLIWKTRNECHSVDRQGNNAAIYGNGCVRLCTSTEYFRCFQRFDAHIVGHFTYTINVKYFLCRCTYECIALLCSTAGVFTRQPRRCASHCSVPRLI